MSPRQRLDHRAIALRLKACPQFELPVLRDPSKTRVRIVARQIRGGALRAYQPPKSFKARWAADPGGSGWSVFACYVGDPTCRDEEAV